MQATRSPSDEMPHSVGALIDTAFVRSAVAAAHEPAGARPAAAPSAWRRAAVWVRAALARLTAPHR
jgi:hypothetical protein